MKGCPACKSTNIEIVRGGSRVVTDWECKDCRAHFADPAEVMDKALDEVLEEGGYLETVSNEPLDPEEMEEAKPKQAKGKKAAG